MDSHWSLSDNKPPRVSWTLFRIIAEVWMVSTCPLISKSSSNFSNPLGECSKYTNYNWYHSHFYVLYFLSSRARSRYLSLFYLSFNFIQYSSETVSLLWVTITRSSHLVEINWAVCRCVSFVKIDSGSWICCIAVIHMQLYTYTCRDKINNNDERTHFFRKIYLSHFIRNGCERVAKGLCVRGELETGQSATYWPQIPLSLAALLSHSAGCSTGGPEDPALS